MINIYKGHLGIPNMRLMMAENVGTKLDHLGMVHA